MSGVSKPSKIPNNFTMQRGSQYNAYAALREAKLRSKTIKNPSPLPPKDHKSLLVSTPPEKMSEGFANRRKGSSVLAQSTPDFSSALRKENRKPSLLPPIVEKSATPPAKGSSRLYEINARMLGSKSSVSSEKRGGGNGMLTARKSYANIDELKKFSAAAANAINGENKGGIGRFGGRAGGRSTVLGYRQFY